MRNSHYDLTTLVPQILLDFKGNLCMPHYIEIQILRSFILQLRTMYLRYMDENLTL